MDNDGFGYWKRRGACRYSTGGSAARNCSTGQFGTDTGTSQWLYTRSLLGYAGKAKTFRYTFNLEVLNSQVVGTETILVSMFPQLFSEHQSKIWLEHLYCLEMLM